MKILETTNFEDMISIQQDLHFSTLEQELIQKPGIKCLTNDILKVFGLCTKNNHYNNAAALLAGENQFKGIKLTRYHNNIHEIYYQLIYDNISILTMLKYVIDEYRKYYQYEVIRSLARETVEEIPEKLFLDAITYALVNHSWNNNRINVDMLKDKIKITYCMNNQYSIISNTNICFLLYRLGYIKKIDSRISQFDDYIQNNSSVTITLSII
ncbi:MAG: hypothetical protein LUG60_01110 [Erysipelotrichaceae bacterium]|nr:hypothetical protein [Erysipelotrichaceae bacterium]